MCGFLIVEMLGTYGTQNSSLTQMNLKVWRKKKCRYL